MNILFNFSTNVIGGGLKNGLQFIKYAVELQSHHYEFHFAISKIMEEALDLSIKSKIRLLVTESPARSLASRRLLRAYCREKDIGLVYTMAGPAYVDFPCAHIMGLSDPFIFQANRSQKYYGRDLPEKVAVFLRSLYKRRWSDHADKFLFQTEASRQAFLNGVKLPVEKTLLLSNSFDTDLTTRNLNLPTADAPVKIFVPCPAYPHKALHQLPALSSSLDNLNIDHKFCLTVDGGSRAGKRIIAQSMKFQCHSNFSFLGYQDYGNIGQYYEDCHFVILPTILETFSATILEAFTARRALIVNDEKFNREIAGSAAFYIDIKDPQNSAEIMSGIFADTDAQLQKIKQGQERLSLFMSQKERFEKVLKIIDEHGAHRN